MGLFRKKDKSKDSGLKSELNKKYNWPVIRKTGPESERARTRSATIIQNNLTSMRTYPHRAGALAYFEETMTTDTGARNLQTSSDKIIGTFCNFIPEELIYAAGARSVRLCAGFHETIAPSEEILPRDICPLIRSSFGAFIMAFPYFDLCQQVIIPTSCDAKKRLADILSDYMTVWTLELPQTKNIEKSLQSWVAEFDSLKNKLSSFTGTKISSSRLKSTIQLFHKRTETARRLHKLRKLEPPVISGRDALLVIQTAFYTDPTTWIDKTNLLCDELEAKTPPPAKETKRLLLTGAPVIWPNYKILNILETSGAVVVADELCSGTRYLYDPVEVDEWTMNGMLKALATRYLYPTTCPCFMQSDDRIDRILQLVDEFACEGVIYHNLRLCQLFDIEQNLVKKVLLEKKIPMLSLQTDYSQEDLGPLKTRVEAFLEMLEF